MELHATTMLLAGLAVLAMAILPRLSPSWPLSTPIVVLAFGFVVFSLPLGLPAIDPIAQGEAAEYLTEFAVIVALMGAGLKIDRPVGWRSWRSTWILLGITMPITIAAAAALGWWFIGLAPATALLLGAALAPTDPVLASEVQVGPPGQGAEREGRVGFSLTSEAGLNDGLAFPFTYAAIAMVAAGNHPSGWFGDWLLVDLLYRTATGIAGGVLVGWALGRLLFGPAVRLSRYTDGLVALAATLVAYGAVELVHGYGFLAVFVTAYVIREIEPDHEQHTALHRFIEQVEHLSLAAVLLLLAGAVAHGVLDPLTPSAIAVAVAIVFVVRPLAGLAVMRSELVRRRDQLAVAWFGIRGIGSIYYLAFALNAERFPDAELLWATVALVVLISVLVHGLTSTPIMRAIDRSPEHPGELDVPESPRAQPNRRRRQRSRPDA